MRIPPHSRTYSFVRSPGVGSGRHDHCTVRVVSPLIPFMVAVIVAVPVATLVAVPTLLIVAIAGLDELQVTDRERFCIVPSLNVPMALKF